MAMASAVIWWQKTFNFFLHEGSHLSLRNLYSCKNFFPYPKFPPPTLTTFLYKHPISIKKDVCFRLTSSSFFLVSFSSRSWMVYSSALRILSYFWYSFSSSFSSSKVFNLSSIVRRNSSIFSLLLCVSVNHHMKWCTGITNNTLYV